MRDSREVQEFLWCIVDDSIKLLVRKLARFVSAGFRNFLALKIQHNFEFQNSWIRHIISKTARSNLCFWNRFSIWKSEKEKADNIIFGVWFQCTVGKTVLESKSYFKQRTRTTIQFLHVNCDNIVPLMIVVQLQSYLLHSFCNATVYKAQ